MHTLRHEFPYLSLHTAMQTLRVTIALLFMAHAGVRVANGSIAQFASFLEARGWPGSLLIVLAVTVWELVAGVLLILNRYLGLACGGLALIAFMGIVIIHARQGWFVGEHGTGGVEYSISLLAALLVVAAYDRNTAASK
ncbi:MAG: DoxX family protein [Burkholderiales bacterium]|nr:DoxX family protein [Burkholderiales bacterium]